MTVAETTPDQVAVAILETIPSSMRAIREHMRSARAAGLSVPQFRLMLFVRRNPGVSLSGLADHLGTTLPAASQLVERLVRSGLVSRVQHPEARRRDVQTRAWLCRALSGMDAKQLQRIQDSLRDLRSALTAEEPPGK